MIPQNFAQMEFVFRNLDCKKFVPVDYMTLFDFVDYKLKSVYFLYRCGDETNLKKCTLQYRIENRITP